MQWVADGLRTSADFLAAAPLSWKGSKFDDGAGAILWQPYHGYFRSWTPIRQLRALFGGWNTGFRLSAKHARDDALPASTLTE